MNFLFWRRKNRDEELDEELQSHLRMAARDRVERGESSEQARESINVEVATSGRRQRGGLTPSHSGVRPTDDLCDQTQAWRHQGRG